MLLMLMALMLLKVMLKVQLMLMMMLLSDDGGSVDDNDAADATLKAMPLASLVYSSTLLPLAKHKNNQNL